MRNVARLLVSNSGKCGTRLGICLIAATFNFSIAARASKFLLPEPLAISALLLPIMAAKHGQARSDKRSHPKSSPRCIKKSVTKASAMTGVWQAWLQHCLVTSRTWVHAALMLAYMFCGRISQILALRGEDFDWDRQQVHFRKFKKHPAVWKPILPVFMKKLKQLRDSGSELSALNCLRCSASCHVCRHVANPQVRLVI